jgi:hypothetical protein
LINPGDQFSDETIVGDGAALETNVKYRKSGSLETHCICLIGKESSRKWTGEYLVVLKYRLAIQDADVSSTSNETVSVSIQIQLRCLLICLELTVYTTSFYVGLPNTTQISISTMQTNVRRPSLRLRNTRRVTLAKDSSC